MPRAPLLLLACFTAGCGLQDFKLDSATDSGAPSGSGGDNGSDTLPDATDTGFTGGSGSGGSGSGGSGGEGSGSGSGAGAGSGSGSGSGGEGTGGDGTTDPIDIAIDSISPAYGITAGGDVVTFTGGPFDSTATVSFGSNEAIVTGVTETTLTVTTPSTTREGVVAVSVETDAGTGRLGSAYRYWEDGRGQYGALGAVELARYTGGYWEGGTPDDILSGVVYLTAPTTYRWFEVFVPSLESCRSETYTSSVSVSVIDPGIGALTLSPTSGSTLSLPFDSTTGAFVNDSVTSLTAGARYELQAPGGALPSENVTDFFRLPSSGPSVSSPSISASTPPTITQNQVFRWSSVGADWVLISMVVDNGVTADGYEAVYCAAIDDGSFTFDGSQFTSWPYGSTAIISVSFVYDQPGSTLPWNLATPAVAGMVSTVGGGFTY